jgi:hypothetical protein
LIRIKPADSFGVKRSGDGVVLGGADGGENYKFHRQSRASNWRP